jgi:Flp pilus assembly protein CpaB
MNTARIVVPTIAAAYLASGLGDKPPPAQATTPQTVDVRAAKSDIGLGQTVTVEALQRQTWPAVRYGVSSLTTIQK